MTCYKDEKRGTWYVGFRYKDWRGEPKRKTKRGFRTKREAADWEASFKRSMEGVATMSFEDACAVYLDEIGPRLRESSLAGKRMMLECRIIPYFTGLAVGEITALHVMEWCSWLAGETGRFGKPLSTSYLNTLRSQLSAVFNHLVRYHGLASNPVHMTLSFEGGEEGVCDVWTVEEYLSFTNVVADKPQVHIAFEILFWCGLRRGEMLALTYGDVDLGKGILRVSKSLSKVGNRDVVGPPKTRQSYRTVAMPQFLVEELGEYFSWNGGASPSDRLLSKVTASILAKELARGAKAAGVKRIRIHDLRHSHATLLVERVYSSMAKPTFR